MKIGFSVVAVRLLGITQTKDLPESKSSIPLRQWRSLVDRLACLEIVSYSRTTGCVRDVSMTAFLASGMCEGDPIQVDIPAFDSNGSSCCETLRNSPPSFSLSAKKDETQRSTDPLQAMCRRRHHSSRSHQKAVDVSSTSALEERSIDRSSQWKCHACCVSQ